MHRSLTAQHAGGIDYIIAPMAVCIAFVSHADPACRSFGASMSQLADEHPAITFAKVDLEGEDAAMLAKEQGVQPDAKLPLFKRYKVCPNVPCMRTKLGQELP